jgi:hypothetical protein
LNGPLSLCNEIKQLKEHQHYLLLGYIWGQYYKTICPQFTNFRNKLVFVLAGKSSQAGLIFAAKVEAYQSEAFYTPGWAPGLTNKH